MSKVSKVLLVLSGLLFIGIGGYMLFHPGITLISLAFVLGIAMAVFGVFAIISYAQNRDSLGAGWLLFDGIISILFSILMFSNQFFAFVTILIPYMFSFWILFKGISGFLFSFDLKKFGGKNWGWMCLLGILCTIVGIVSIFEPLVTAFIFTIILGSSFIVYGIITILQPFTLEDSDSRK